MVQRLLFFIIVSYFFFGCSQRPDPRVQVTKSSTVTIKTEFGDIRVLLYNSTPKHRDNFLTLVKQKFYNGVIFHRVVKNYIIQGGDPYTKKASLKDKVGTGDIGYTIPAEIAYPSAFHKRGALAAARLNDDVNPTHNSSGCQFYIVEGGVYTDEELDGVERVRKDEYKERRLQTLTAYYRAKIDSLNFERMNRGLLMIRNSFSAQIDEEIRTRDSLFVIPPQVREIYKTQGGIPALDREYTVFGEVISGMDVVDHISMMQTSPNERPTTNVIISAFVDR